MRICQIVDSYFPVYDGVAIAVDNYTKILNKNGQDCFVVAPSYKNSNINFDYEVLKCLTTVDPFNKTYRWPLPMLDVQLKKALMKDEISLIHAHGPFMVGHFGLRLAKAKKIPIVATFHTKFYDDLLESTHSKLMAKLTLKYIVKFYENCDCVIAVSEHAKETLKQYGYRGEARIIPNGVDFTVPKYPDVAIKEIKKEYNIQAHEEVLLYVGMHNFKKNIKLIYEAAALYKKTNPNFKLLMVGAGNHLKKIKEMGETLGIHENIIYVGTVRDRSKLAKIYLTADLFVFPSTYDTISIVTREAACCETPSVVVKKSGPAEGITHNVNGFLCEENKASLAEQIEFALSNKTNLKKIAKEAAKTLPVTWEKVVEQVSDIYQELLEKNNE